MGARYTIAVRDGILDLIASAIDGGPGPGILRLYSGRRPASADDELAGNVLLAELAFSKPCAPIADGGVLTFAPLSTDAEAMATGTATFARVADSRGRAVADWDVGPTGSGATLSLNTVQLVAGGPVKIGSASIRLPAA